MDPKMKTALAVAIGVVLGMTLLGAAVAIPAAMHAVAFTPRAAVADGYGFVRGPMGPGCETGGAGACGSGMMGRGGQACPGGDARGQRRGDAGCGQGAAACGQGGAACGQGGASIDPGACPNGEACPRIGGSTTDS